MPENELNKYSIIHLSSVHKPFDIRIFQKECKSLAQNGFNVSLIVPHNKDEVVNDIRCIPIKKDPNRFYRMIRTTWRIYKKALSENGDVYHFHDPELIPVGIYLKMKGKKVIYDVHENVPDQILDKHWIPLHLRWLVAKAVGFIEQMGSKFFFDGVVAATPTIAKRFPPKKTIIVQNFPKLNLQPIKEQETLYSDRSNVVIYVGVITEQRGIKQVIKSIGLVPKHLGTHLYLAGEFVPQNLLLEVREMQGWDCVKFFGLKSHELILDLFQHARIGIAILHPTPQYLTSLPIKLFEYMSAGLPVIASNFQLWKSIVEKNKCGILVDPLNPKEIAQAIQWLLENPHEAEEMGRRGQEAVRLYYHWEMEEKKLLQLYQRIVA